MHVFKGKTAKFYLPGVRYIHGPVRGRYRIMWPDYRSRYIEALQSGKSKPADIEELTVKVVADLVSEWDAVYPDDHPDEKLRGKPIPITEEFLLKECYQPTYILLQRIVLGFDESPADPKDPVGEQLDAVERSSKTPEELFELLRQKDEESVGNSDGGCG